MFGVFLSSVFPKGHRRSVRILNSLALMHFVSRTYQERPMKFLYCVVFLLALLAGCDKQQPPAEPKSSPRLEQPSTPEIEAGQFPLVEARRNFKTKLIPKARTKVAPDEPPPKLFQLVRYESPAGKLKAYLSPPPQDGKKHPAIMWLFGGFGNGIGETAWAESEPENDQSGSAFRKAGIVMMYPSLRGGNDNPGSKEGFYGEVDDVLAAAEYLASQDYVDPDRIYLGGHSTGGTLALLATACTNRFRATFSFGPADGVGGYGADVLPFDVSNQKELDLRAPGRWVYSIQTPVFIFEGTGMPGNVDSLHALANAARNAPLKAYPVRGATHFSILAPVTRNVAQKIVRDDGPKVNITFTDQELQKLFEK